MWLHTYSVVGDRIKQQGVHFRQTDRSGMFTLRVLKREYLSELQWTTNSTLCFSFLISPRIADCLAVIARIPILVILRARP